MPAEGFTCGGNLREFTWFAVKFLMKTCEPLIVSRQSIHDNNLPLLLHCSQEKVHVAATYNLLFNGSIMVEEGMGYAICFDHIINVSGDSSLCYRPLAGSFDLHMHIVWKK